MGKIISVFSHKGGVGKTTFVYNMAFVLANRGKRVLLIDADSQMNLTACVFGRLLDVDYGDGKKKEETLAKENEELKKEWQNFIDTYVSFNDYFSDYVDGREHSKKFYVCEKQSNIELMAGSISIDTAALIWIDIILGPRIMGGPRDQRIVRFQESIVTLKGKYDYILIDTPPSASSIINAMVVCSSDYFVVPTFPNFFSAQAANNLGDIFERWVELLSKHRGTGNYKGFDIRTKFMGALVQKSSPMNRKQNNEQGATDKSYENQHTYATREWTQHINKKLVEFINDARASNMLRGLLVVSEDKARECFHSEENWWPCPWIVHNVRNFTPELERRAAKRRIPFVCLDTELDKGEKMAMDGNQKKVVDAVKASYKRIAEGFDRLPDRMS